LSERERERERERESERSLTNMKTALTFLLTLMPQTNKNYTIFSAFTLSIQTIRIDNLSTIPSLVASIGWWCSPRGAASRGNVSSLVKEYTTR